MAADSIPHFGLSLPAPGKIYCTSANLCQTEQDAGARLLPGRPDVLARAAATASATNETHLPEPTPAKIETISKKKGPHMGPQETIACAIAYKAHEGQTDKAGAPYIGHPAHVASQVEGDATKAVAWLHDVVEDTPLTFDDLRAAGIGDDVIAALRLLTHDKRVPYLDYVANLKNNELARAVKLADLAHNSDLGRLPEVTQADRERTEKYRRAIALLES
jgi:hypothetical protein